MDAVTLALLKSMAGGSGGGGGGEKFIATLTPTALDLSGTMDKTVSEINAAYEAGKDIWFSISVGAATLNAKLAIVTDINAANPMFTFYVIDTNNNVLVVGYNNSYTDDGDTYGTTIYPLESSGGGVLVIHETVSGGTHTLDKTWQEIYDADFPVLITEIPDGGRMMRIWITDIAVLDDNDIVMCNGVEYHSGTADGYPTFSE